MTQKKIRILFVLPDLRGGGAQKVTALLLNNISKRKFSVSLALIENTGVFIKSLDPDIKIHDLKCKRRRYAFFPLICLFREMKPDIIFSTLYDLNIAVILSCLLGFIRIPVVIREAITLSEYVGNKYAHRFLLKMTYPKANRIVCSTEAMAEDMYSYVGISDNSTVIIPNPVADNIYTKPIIKSKKNSDETNFLFVGRLSHQKGVDVLLKGFKKLLTLYRNANLLIMGTGEEEQKLKSLTESLRITSRVHFLGFVNNPMSYLGNVAALIISSRYEGMPNAALEALAHGFPVLSSNIPAVRPLIQPGKNGLLFEANNSDSLADALMDFLKNGVEWDKERIKQNVGDYHIDKIVQKYEEIFLEIIQDTKATEVE